MRIDCQDLWISTIEHVWGGLGRAIAQHNPPARTIEELKVTLLDEWALVP